MVKVGQISTVALFICLFWYGFLWKHNMYWDRPVFFINAYVASSFTLVVDTVEILWCEDWLHFFVICESKLDIFGFGLNIWTVPLYKEYFNFLNLEVGFLFWAQDWFFWWQIFKWHTRNSGIQCSTHENIQRSDVLFKMALEPLVSSCVSLLSTGFTPVFIHYICTQTFTILYQVSFLPATHFQ